MMMKVSLQISGLYFFVKIVVIRLKDEEIGQTCENFFWHEFIVVRKDDFFFFLIL